MNKEMLEILEIKENLNELKKSTNAEIAKIAKKVKDSKNDNNRFIQSKFEEIMESYSFSINNNPNLEKFLNEEEINELIDKKIKNNDKEQEIDELTTLMEEIADKVVDENKKLKERIKKIEESEKLAEAQNTLEDSIATLESKFQGNKLDTAEQIHGIKEQLDLIKEKILNIEDIENLIHEVIEGEGKDE